MDFTLPEHVEALREEVRRFAQREIRPHVMDWDEARTFPMEVMKKLGQMGMLGVIFPEAYGGAGMGYLEYAVVVEELSRVDGSVGLSVAAHNSLCANHIYAQGSEEQRRRYLAPLASGQVLGTWALTEPGSGSDAGALRTTARKQGDTWVLNGTKNFATHGTVAGIAVVMARTRSGHGGDGISAFILEKGTPGFRAGKQENKLGMRASDTSELILEEVAVPEANLLGEAGIGFKQAMETLDGGRISIAALALGMAQGAFEASVKYAAIRRTFGKPINEHQAIQFKLADMQVQIEAARLLVYQAASLKDQGLPYAKAASMAKLYASEMACRVADEAVQIHGGYGFIKDYPVEKFYRDVKLCTIGEGTSEVQRMVIARHIIKESPGVTVIRSQLLTSSEAFRQNRAHNLALCERLAEQKALLQQGGGAKALARHREQGKTFVRDRIAALCDPGAPFLEVGLLAALDVYDDPVPAAGLVAGVGLVAGRPCMVIANDATVKGGTYYPLTVKKHLRAQEIALENRLPCLYLVDSGGAFLPLQAEVFPDREHFGRIFYNQAMLSAAGIPQLSAVMGSCTAGGAYVPAMSDQTVIVNRTGTIFLGGPPLVKAATGEDVSAEELGGARVHTELSGVADHFAEDDAQALQILREMVGHLGPAPGAQAALRTPEPPACDPDEILGVWPRDLRRQGDIRETLARLVDGSRLFEFKERYATTLVTGFAHLEGLPCGLVANNGVLFGESALKAAHFIELCTAQKIPLVFLQNITGFMVGAQAERGGIAKDGAKMVHAVATARVPKITLLLGGSFGAGNYGMCGRAYGPRFLWSWPTSRISVMGGEQAAAVLVTVKRDQLEREGRTLADAEAEAIARPILEQYEREGHPYYASARLWDDGVIDLRATRAVLAASLACALSAPVAETRMGVLRM